MKDPHALSLLTILLLNAEWQDGKSIIFKGKQTELKAGQLTAGSKQLAEWTGQTRQMIRWSIQKLKTTNIITTQTTNRFTLFSIVNFKSYQGEVTNSTTNQVTNKQPTSNQQTTTLEAFKNISIKEKESAPRDPSKQVCLKSIEMGDLEEPAKHKIFNQLLKTFRVRGWKDEPEYVKTVLQAVVSRMDRCSPKEFYPYFAKAAQNYINQNAEALSADARIHKNQVKKLGITVGSMAI